MFREIYLQNKKFIIDLISDQIEIDVAIDKVDIEVCYGIYGLVKYNLVDYVIIVSKAKIAGSVDNFTVYEINEVELIPTSTDYDLTFINEIKSFFSLGGIYFSEYQLHELYSSFNKSKASLSYSKLFRRKSESIEESSSMHFLEDRNDYLQTKTDRSSFIFNKAQIENYIKKYESNKFCIKCIQGYFGQYKELVLISRRNIGRIGTRYLCRGAISDGSCANLVETEQIILKKCSFINLRGSIPLEWSQLPGFNYSPPILVTNDYVAEHNQLLQKLYEKRIFYLNLLKTEGGEKEIYNLFVQSLRRNKVNFYCFDFHNDLNRILFPIPLDVLSINTRISRQGILIRTNCIDSLDRTNAMQFYMSMYIFNKKQRIYVDKEEIDFYLYHLRLLWKQNGDNLAMQYAGTPAMHSRHIVHQNRILSGFNDMKSGIARYFINRMGDNQTNEIYKLLSNKECNKIEKRRNYYMLSNRNIFITLLFILFVVLGFYSKNKIEIGKNILNKIERQAKIEEPPITTAEKPSNKTKIDSSEFTQRMTIDSVVATEKKQKGDLAGLPQKFDVNGFIVLLLFIIMLIIRYILLIYLV